MKQIIIVASIVLFGCNQHTKTPDEYKPQVDTCEFIYHSPIDTTEKHFDCIVEECYEDQPGDWLIFTECGICIHSNCGYRVGDTLKNFQSPKHK